MAHTLTRAAGFMYDLEVWKGRTACRRVLGKGDKGLHKGRGAPRADTLHVEMEGQFPRTKWQYVQGPIVNGVHPCCPLFVFGVTFLSWPGWTGDEVFFWTRLPHCSRVVSDGEVEICLKRPHHQPDDHYDWVGGALSLYSPRLGAHSGRHLGGSRACWTLSGFVGGHFPAANGPPVLVIRPSVGHAPPTSPPSPSASRGTGPRWVGLLGCWTWR